MTVERGIWGDAAGSERESARDDACGASPSPALGAAIADDADRVHGRRTFLRLAIATVAVAGCSGNAGAPEAFGDVSAGNVSALSVASIARVPGASACIARDAKGVYAMTLTCTHQGCDMGVDGRVAFSGIDCGCHGSQFDANGAVVRGPAQSPLQHYAVSVDGQGNLTVHGGTPVDATTRLAV